MIVKRIGRAQYVAQRADGHDDFDDGFVSKRMAVAGLADLAGSRDQRGRDPRRDRR